MKNIFNTMENEPTLYLDFDENDMTEGMSALSFVDRPATEIKWEIFQDINDIYFSKQEFRDFNDEKRLVTAPVMIAETSIPRFNPDLGKYWVKFSKETIFRMMKKYFKENKIHTINTNHDSKQQRDGIFMVESYIVGERNSSKLFSELPEGSWVATFYVDNDEVWQKIKDGEYNGFSLEGFFIEKYEDDMLSKVTEKLHSIINSNIDDYSKELQIKTLLNIL